jgi:hypothetical protein
MPTGRRKPDPDRILCARMSESAVRLAQAVGPIEQAVAELRALAAGRGDLLAEQAGIMVGAGSGQNAPLFTTVHSTITQPAGAGQWRDRDHLRRPAARVEVRVVSRWQRARSSARSRSR